MKITYPRQPRNADDVAQVRALITEYLPRALRGGGAGFENTASLIGAEVGPHRLSVLLGDIARTGEDFRTGLITRIGRFRSPLSRGAKW